MRRTVIGNSYNENTYGNPEIVSLCASNNNAVHEQYQQFMNAFETFVGDNGFADDIQAISISCGHPVNADFLRMIHILKAVNLLDRDTPREVFYSAIPAIAISSFQSAMGEKYKNNIGTLNKQWGTNLKSFTDISPPTNGDGFLRITVRFLHMVWILMVGITANL